MKNPNETNHHSPTSSPFGGADPLCDCPPARVPGRVIMLLGCLVAMVGVAFLPFSSFHSHREIVKASVVKPVNVASGDELISLLKEKGLWEITGGFAVPRMILSSYPANIGNLDTEAKKKAFFNSLLPTALVAMGEVEKEKATLRAIIARIPGGNRDLVLSEPLDSWAGGLSRQEIDTLMSLGLKYRTDRTEDLVQRVDVVPLSLLLAQAALESSWGSSRIARDGNNLFGMLTWGENAVPLPSNSDGSGHRYANYDSILDSVRAYIVMLNRLSSYERFREIRSRSQNPLELAEGLGNYSVRRNAYILDVKGMIIGNSLNRYDDYFLAAPVTKPENNGLLARLARRFNLGAQSALT